jgi:hypothetical protein|tara:strand:+ start:860 stop:1399 length:540 start_codon:yes stop_codon:yes gene_type:complete
MCGVNEAVAAMKIVGAVAGHQEKKRVAKENAMANARARMTADAAYLNDLGKIETERGMAAREKYIAEMSEKMKRKKDQATGLNLGFGNATRVVQNIGTIMDVDYNQINADFLGDMITLNNQRSDAYANLKRTYNSLTPVYEPSMFSLGLDIAGAGASYMATPRDERAFFKDYGAKSRTK